MFIWQHYFSHDSEGLFIGFLKVFNEPYTHVYVEFNF